MPNGEPLKGNVMNRVLFASRDFNQSAANARLRLSAWARSTSAAGWLVQRGCRRIVKPFTGSVQFFKDVFDHAVVLVHAHLAIVLPTTFVRDLARFVFARDQIVIPAPARAMHGVNVSTGRIRPILCS